MKKEMVEIVCIVDRSGSMAAVRSDAVGGFNTFLEEQKKLPGEARLTLVLFNDSVDVVHLARPIAELEPFDERSYVPSGSTALLDAVGRTIDKVGQRLAATPEAERPGKVIVAILTDGEENASRKYDLKDVRERIRRQREVYKWEFVFLAANQDAFAEAEKLAIPQADAEAFVASAEGVRVASSKMSDRVRAKRGVIN